MAEYMSNTATGVLQNPEATSNCGYCSLTDADQYLANSGMHWGNRWRDFGLVWVYILATLAITVSLYYFFRVLPLQRKRKAKKVNVKKVEGMKK